MNLWKPLQPTASGSGSAPPSLARPGSAKPPAHASGPLSSFRPLVPSAPSAYRPSATTERPTNPPLPAHTIQHILAHLPVPDVPAFARTCRAFARAARDGNGVGWRARWEAAGGEVGEPGKTEGGEGSRHARNGSLSGGVNTSSSAAAAAPSPAKPPSAKPAPTVFEDDDEFGDFASQSLTRLALGSGAGEAVDADGFGDFSAGPSVSRKAAAGPSLLDLDFEDANPPLPSSPTQPTASRRRTSSSAANGSANGNARRTSGFFALSEKGLASLPVPRDVPAQPPASTSRDYLALYRAHHTSLLPLVRAIRNNTSTTSSTHLLSLLLSHIPATASTPTPASASLGQQADLIIRLLRFLSPAVQPTIDWGWLRMTLVRGGIADRFEGVCLGAFEKAEERIIRRRAGGGGTGAGADFTREEDAADMARVKESAQASWRVYSAANASKLAEASTPSRNGARSARGLLGGSPRNGEEARREARRRMAEEWELGRVWIEKKEVFYEGNKWDSAANIVKIPAPSGTDTTQILEFTPMTQFIDHLLEAIKRDGRQAMDIFPLEAGVLIGFVDRIGIDVVAEYINPLLAQTRLSPAQDLYLTAAAASFAQAWRLVDATIDVYRSGMESRGSLDEALLAEARRDVEDVIYRLFETNMEDYLDEETEWVKKRLESICAEWNSKLGTSATTARQTDTTFLSSSNPDQVKRNVLAGFKDALLLPVTIVPLTVSFGVNAIVTGGTRTVNGLSMLNPQRWGGQAATTKQVKASVEVEKVDTVQSAEKAEDVTALSWNGNVDAPTSLMPPEDPGTPWGDEKRPPGEIDVEIPTSTPSTTKVSSAFDRLQLLISLDTALELIHADRESLKRIEAFRGYHGKYGKRVQDALEEVFILLLQSTGNRHIAPGFRRAIDQMGTYQPEQHEETTSVAPLLQFFELVHIGDTIQSMVQVYFDKELSAYVDRTDFLNGVMQEKKRFEATLDDSVAGGLNAGIEVLMNQVEHIIQTRTKPGEYCPPAGADLELGPTKGCQDAISCLEMHCNLLKGSTSKEVLEVFYQEVGIRLQSILQKHMKRQIISVEGGFQMIADLNAYHAFISSLKQQRITDDFSSLKMLGHVFIVSDAKDLAQIIRDVTRYGGSFRPEDVYEFIQRRSDWKKIEKTVDKSMYALSVKEDCTIM